MLGLEDGALASFANLGRLRTEITDIIVCRHVGIDRPRRSSHLPAHLAARLIDTGPSSARREYEHRMSDE
jgi:hypothetical protein